MFKPDFDQLLTVLNGGIPDRPVLFEFFLHTELYKRIAGPQISSMTDRLAARRTHIMAYKNAGYDYVTLHGSDFRFKSGAVHSEKTKSLNEGALITDRKSFDNYVWPNPADYPPVNLDDAQLLLPGGMKVILYGPGGVLENVIQLVGYDNLCFMLYEDPELVKLIFDNVGSTLYRYYEQYIHHPAVGAVISNDDWGFNQQTMLAPSDMRKYVFPWHEAIVTLAHDHGFPVILHSCGRYDAIIEDVIAMGYDARHSYEDNITPIETAYEQLKGRIAVLGGIDVDYVCTKSPDAVHARSRKMLERGMQCGGYALGTGNSVPYYVPDDGYFAMIKAAHDLRK